MEIISDLRIPLEKDKDLKKIIAAHLNRNENQISEIRILKKSLDARGQKKFWVYTLEVYSASESPKSELEEFPKLHWQGKPPLIIGAGPAGLFAAWTFLEHGIKPILVERGDRMHSRMQKISRYWRQGLLDPDTNVCNGEGGAGTFSDGKLITRIKSPLIKRVMKILVECGAPTEITYVYNPHVGSNLIRSVIKNLTDTLILKGAELHFNARVQKLHLNESRAEGIVLADGKTIKSTGVILACGHSAGDFFKALHDQGVFIEPKSFALGVRVEHSQVYINQWQMGSAAVPDEIKAAQYKLTSYWDQEDIGVYTFCMCPGGYVVSSTTDPETIVVNGMSNYHRNSPWANAAVVVSIPKEKISGDDLFKMMTFQREIEKNVFRMSRENADGKKIPVQRLEDFLSGKLGCATVKSSCPSGSVKVNLKDVFPDWVYQYLCDGFLEFEKKRPGFIFPDAVVHAVESRTSSPIRITRNSETLESINTEGLFPCGEGPGYAGGITSAAVDGIKSALAWIEKYVK